MRDASGEAGGEGEKEVEEEERWDQGALFLVEADEDAEEEEELEHLVPAELS